MLGTLHFIVSLLVLFLLAYWSLGIKKRVRQLERMLEALTIHVWDTALLVRDLPAGALPHPPAGWAASSDLLVSLAREIRTNRPGLVVELGSGVSTLVMANELRRLGRGRLVAVEHDAGYARKSREMIESAGLADRAEVRIVPLARPDAAERGGLWYDRNLLDDLDQVDLLFVDGPPGNLAPGIRGGALEHFWPRLAPQGRIVLDDADRPDERAFIDRWVNANPDCALEWLGLQRTCAVLQKTS